MARHRIHSIAFKKQVVQEYAAGRPLAAWPPGPLHATLWWAGLGAHFFNFISGQLVRGDEISCSRVYVVPFSAASFACRRAFNLVVFSSVWTGAPFALTGCFVTAANSASARVRCFEVSDIGLPRTMDIDEGSRVVRITHTACQGPGYTRAPRLAGVPARFPPLFLALKNAFRGISPMRARSRLADGNWHLHENRSDRAPL